MSFIHHTLNQIHCKIIYCGANLSGKTTNIQSLHRLMKQKSKDHLMLLTHKKTLFFDFLTIPMGKIANYHLRLQLYGLSEKVNYELFQHFIFKGIDGIIFVTDSQNKRMDANLQSYETLEKSLEKQGYDLNQISLIFQYNKRDLLDILSIQELQSIFNPMHRPYFASIAHQGKGVVETLQIMSQMIIQNLKIRKIP